MSSDSNDLTAVVPRRPRKRDEAVRRRVRALRAQNPHLCDPAVGPALRRLAELSWLSERLFSRAREADSCDDGAAFVALCEGYRRASDSMTRLESRLGIGPRALRPPDLALVLAAAVRERRQPQIDFAGPNGADKPASDGDPQ
jgi:hypothetical protein